MLAANLLRAVGASGGAATPVDCTYITSTVRTTNVTTYTFSSQSLGTAAANRYIVVVAGGYQSTNQTVDSCTVAGVSATRVVTATNLTPAAAFIAKVPKGATGDIVITFSAEMLNAGIGVYRLVNIRSATPTATATDLTASSAAMDADLTIPTDGCGIGYVIQRNTSAPRTWIWTNLTENFDATVDSTVSHSGAMSTTAGTLNRKAQASGSLGAAALVLAAWR